MKYEYLLWLDIETTGLDEKAGKILELEYILTPRYSLNHIASGGSVLYAPNWKDYADDFVQNMHEASGLAVALYSVNPSLEHVEGELVKQLKTLRATHTDDDDVRIYLAGASVQFDRRWIKVHMEALEKELHYRMLDVSSIKLAFGPHGIPPAAKTHRATTDIRESIAMLKHFREILSFDESDYQ